MLIDWRPKPGKPSGKASKKQVATKTPNARRGTKGKHKAIEVDPIEPYEEDSPYEISEGEDEITTDEITIVNGRPLARIGHQHDEDDVEITTTSTMKNSPVFDLDPSNLYKQMCNLRDQIVLKDSDISDPEEVFADTTLQYLSVICPQDYKSFISNMQDDVMDEEEATVKFNKYGAGFLDLCIQHNFGSDAPKSLGLDVARLRSHYRYSPVASASSRKSKFRPHR